MSLIYSTQVNWLTVHEFVAPVLDRVGSWPLVGSVEWSSLEDDDPRKLAAVFDAARHHALRVDAAQEQRAEASRAISDAADWSAISRRIHQQRDAAYIPRERAS